MDNKCTYCNYPGYSTHIVDFNLNFGVLKTAEVATYIGDDYIYTSVTQTEGFNCTNDLGWCKIKINYCPMCGRKLSKD